LLILIAVEVAILIEAMRQSLAMHQIWMDGGLKSGW